MSRVFALVDCNSFYCSCERIFKPHLENHPVIVLSNNDGCAIALSTQAKELGVKMGDPYFKIKELIHTHNIAVFSSNYAFYGDISKRVMATLGALSTTNLEIYSIDIVCSRSFGAPLAKKEDVRAALHHHLMRGCRKLRKQMVQARHLSIFIQGNRFSKTLPYYANAAATTLLLPSNYTPDLSKAADLLFERIWKENTPYTKAGIMLGDFVPHVATRASLFDTRDLEKQRKVMEAVDTLNARYGSSSITIEKSQTRR
jgi:nucleotidyltransferase/DNA polymerase involved in DNA repair